MNQVIKDIKKLLKTAYGITGIIACDINGGIAKNHKLPWNNKEELHYFLSIIKNKPLIMGKSTHDVIPIRSKSRLGNIVITTKAHYDNLLDSTEYYQYIHQNNSFYSNFDTLRDIYYNYILKLKLHYMCIGGGIVIKNLIQYKALNRCLLTIFHDQYDSDTYMDLNFVIKNAQKQKILFQSNKFDILLLNF